MLDLEIKSLGSIHFFGDERGLPSQVKGARLRTLSRRGSWVQIPPPALGGAMSASTELQEAFNDQFKGPYVSRLDFASFPTLFVYVELMFDVFNYYRHGYVTAFIL